MNCKFATKSFCMASNTGLGKELVEHLASEGFDIKAQQSGRDFGVECHLWASQEIADEQG